MGYEIELGGQGPQPIRTRMVVIVTPELSPVMLFGRTLNGREEWFLRKAPMCKGSLPQKPPPGSI